VDGLHYRLFVSAGIREVVDWLTQSDCIEILPLSIRARGLAIYNLSVSLAGFVNQYVNPIGLQNLGWKCMSLHFL